MTALLLGMLFLGVTAVRSLWLWRTEGINPYVIDHHDPMHRFVAQVFAVVTGGLLVYAGAIAVAPEMESAFGLLSWAVSPGTRWAGTLIMGVAIVWTGYSQFAMGRSWRIGIPREAPALRTDAAFAVSRNPIFLGMLAFVIGFALWSPSAVTMTMVAATYIALEVQIRSEEAFLEHAHGATYRTYHSKVRRWL